MTPRLSLPDVPVDQWGLPDTSTIAPAITDARFNARRTAFRMRSVDAVTTELVRIRNARFQNCLF